MITTNSLSVKIKKIVALAAGALLILGYFPGIASASTHVKTITIGSQVGTLTAGTAGSATYTVTVTGNGAGGLTVTPSVSGLPSGVTGSFNPTTVNVDNQTSAQTTLTLTTTSGASSGTASFTVGNNQSSDTASGSLTIGAPVDTTAPVITLTGSSPVTVNKGSTYTDAGATATDNVDASVTVVTTGTVDTNTVGTYTLHYNATDAAGNHATEVTRTVNVVNNTIPVITLLGSSDVTVSVGSTYTDAGATAVDQFGTDITPNIVTTGLSIDTSTPGDFTITYNVSAVNSDNPDGAPLQAVPVTRTVHVVATPLVTIKVHKVTDPENVDKDFTFTVREGTTGEGTIVATSTANAKVDGNDAVFSNLPAGNYTVTEDVPAFWNLSNVSCVYDESKGSSITNGEAVSLPDNGDEADCTFTNTATRGSIQVVKVILPADSDTPVTTDTHTFGVVLAQGDSLFAPHSLSVGNDVLFDNLFPGVEYTLSETADSDYTTVSILPDQDAEVAGTQVIPEAGVTTVVTITNRQNAVTSTTTDTTSTTTTPVVPRPGGRGPSGGRVLGAEIGPGDEGGSCTPYLTGYIKYGADNDADNVKKLQTFLNTDENAGLTVTGVYDDATLAAVKAFQIKESDYVLKPWIDAGFADTVATGYVYKTTLWRINSLNCAGTTIPMPILP